MKSKKAFTLIELLVVIAIIALLVSILMPALSRARELANQLKCGTQFNGIGKVIALYQNDFKEINPTVFPDDSDLYTWDGTFFIRYETTRQRWRNFTQSGGDWLATWSLPSGGWRYPTVGGCIWLLVRYEDIVPNMFLCPSAEEGEEMDLQVAISGVPFFPQPNPSIENWADCIDFWTLRNWTYGYNDPKNALLDTTANSVLVLMADKSPAYFKNDDEAPEGNHNGDMNLRMRDEGSGGPDPCYRDRSRYPVSADWSDDGGKNVDPGNSTNHNTECQNVLYADMHVTKHENPLAGFNKDNIYSTHGTPADGYPADNASAGINTSVQIGVWDGGSSDADTDTKIMN